MHLLHAQVPDPHLSDEVNAVNAIRVEVARSNLALRRYTWIEHTEVLVTGKLQSVSDAACRYDVTGQVVKEPLGINQDPVRANGLSNRPAVRKKADLQDFIKRVMTLTGYYVPPNPEQLDLMLGRGDALLAQSEAGKLQIRFNEYHQRGDSMTFTYDPVSKALLLVTVLSTLGSPKDPVRVEAVFETLPDGVNHLASTTVTAKSRRVEVKIQNLSYTKAK